MTDGGKREAVPKISFPSSGLETQATKLRLRRAVANARHIFKRASKPELRGLRSQAGAWERGLITALVVFLASVCVRAEELKPPQDAALANEGLVVTVALSPDGTRLATGGVGRTLRVWDATTGKEVRQLEHPGGVSSLSFRQDGKQLASAGGDGCVRVWHLDTGKQGQCLKVERGESLVVAFSPDGQTLASAGRGIRLWDAASGKELHHVPGTERVVFGLAFSPDGKVLASGGEDQTIRLWTVATGAPLKQWRHRHGVTCLAFSGDGQALASGGADGSIRLWNPATAKEARPLGGRLGRPACWSLAFSADGKTLAGAGNGATPTIRRWEVASGKELDPLPGFRDAAAPVAFADSRRLADRDGDPLALLWDVADPTKPRSAPAFNLGGDEIVTLWTELAGTDASLAAEAAVTLAGDARRTVPLLKERIKPEPAFPPVARMVADLDDARFAVRQRATDELERMGKTAEDPLRQLLTNKPALEVRKRAERLLDRIERGVLPPEQQRSQRAVQILEQIGTPEALAVLRGLTAGAPESLLTREAKSALERLER